MALKKPDRTKAIVIGGSAGSFPVICEILANLPADYPIPVVLCLHRLKHVREGFVEALQLKSKLPVHEPEDKENIKGANVYLAPANYHMAFELGYTISLSTEEAVNYSRPAIDITFASSAFVYKNKMVGIILSGANKDGAHGLARVQLNGGVTIVQKPEDCKVPTMPLEAMKATKVDYKFSVEEIIRYLKDLPN